MIDIVAGGKKNNHCFRLKRFGFLKDVAAINLRKFEISHDEYRRGDKSILLKA